MDVQPRPDHHCIMDETALAISNLDRKILPGPQFLDDLVSCEADTNPAITYLETDNKVCHFSYRELHQASQALACRVQRHRFSKQSKSSIIPVVLPQSPILYISYLAVLMCGAAFCPILPDTPHERLQFIVKDVDAELVLCTPEMAQSLQNLLPSAMCMPVEPEGNTDHYSSGPLIREVLRDPEDIAYVMYTSGSTGKPKGVPVSHRAVTQALIAHDEHIPAFTSFLQFAAPTFDVSVFEIFFPWFRKVTLASAERGRLLGDLPGTINRLNVDAVELTPTVVTTLLGRREDVPGLKLMLTIGEMLSQRIIKEYGRSEAQPGILYAMYGPTEASIHCTILPDVPVFSDARNIGRPLSTVTAFIVSESEDSQKPVLLRYDQPGELVVAGQLANGYLNRHAQTTAAFITLQHYGLAYRTGDRALMKQDGTLQILGRIVDGQVKLRGQRVELGEVESVALQVEGVDVAAALIIQDNLILFCSCQAHVKRAQIEDRCLAWLPQHMRPSEIIVLAGQIPRLPSGKIDRKNLRSVYQDMPINVNSEGNSAGEAAKILPRIREVISEELAVDVDVEQPLLAAGLNSLKAIVVASRLREHYPRISVLTVLEAESISHLSMSLENQKAQYEPPTAKSSKPCDTSTRDLQSDTAQVAASEGNTRNLPRTDRHFPCNPMQCAMLAETLKNPAMNLNTITLSAIKPVSYVQLLSAFKHIARANPILSSSFEATQDPKKPFIQIAHSDQSFQEKPSLCHPLSISQGNIDREFVITIHHAMYDGWSWELLMNDLNNLLNGGELQARPSFQSYCDNLERQLVVNHEKDLTAWVDLLRSVEFSRLPVLCTTLPESPSRCRYTTTLSNSTSHLALAASQLQINKATFVHAALSLSLAAYIGTEDVVTGLVLAGREAVIPNVEDVIGPCLLTLPLLARTCGLLTGRDYIVQFYRQYMHCLRHSSTSLADIRTALGVSADTSLFDAIFVWQESVCHRDSNCDYIVTSTTHDKLDYTLVVEVEPKDDVLNLTTTFDDSRISEVHIQCLHALMDSLVQQFMQKPEIPLDDIWTSAPSQLLSHSQAIGLTHVDDLTTSLFTTALQFPDRIAVDFVDSFNPTTRAFTHRILTYDQLHRNAAVIANNLINSFGLIKNDVVAICCSKSPELYTTVYAIVSAGFAYLCIDPDTPIGRLREILQEAMPKILVTDHSISSNPLVDLSYTTTDLAYLVNGEEFDWSGFKIQSSGSDLAYAVFTSGSTGVPKGVLITRENLTSNLHHLSSVYPFTASSRLLQSCSQAFDVSVFEIFWTWTAGLTLCSANKDVLFRDIESFIDALEITHLSMTPSVAALVDPSNVPKVTFLVCAGEPMSAKVFEAWVDYGLHQGYGPSETTNICNVRHYRDGKALINNVGPPFPNTSILVCSRTSSDHVTPRISEKPLSLLPRGALGEIWIGGQQVGRGYSDRNLSQRSFIDHPKYGRLFKSGDFGRLLADDSLVIEGREDDQTKIRGQRIELNEINSRLIQSGQVVDCYSLILLAGDEQHKLISFWVPREQDLSGYQPAIAMIYGYLYNILPTYMIPEALIPMQELPLTAQGKVDKRTLIDRYNGLEQLQIQAFSVRPTVHANDRSISDLESKLTSVFSEMMGIPNAEINRYSSLFSYGLDSIKAIAFARRLNQAASIDLDISQIMKNASISGLASCLENSVPSKSSSSVARDDMIPREIERVVAGHLEQRGLTVSKILPCTPLQTALLSTGSSKKVAYSNHLVYRLNMNPSIVKRAWKTTVQCHDLLRTMFLPTEHVEYPYLQIVLQDFELPWQESKTDELDLTVTAFDHPPYLLRLVSKGASQLELHLFIHHALYDAEALQLIHSHIEAVSRGQPIPDSTPFTAYLRHMSQLDQNQSLQFWNWHLKDVKVTRLFKAVQLYSDSSDGSAARYSLSWSSLTAHARKISTTPLAILQTALARLLSGYLRSNDVCFGTVFSGRNIDIINADKIIGPCFNTLPTRSRLRTSSSTQDVCESLHHFNTSVLPYQSTSLRDLQRQFSPNGESLFDVLLLLQSPAQSLDPSVWTLILEEGQMEFPFILEVQPDLSADSVTIILHTSPPADKTFVDDLLGHFVDLIRYSFDSPHKLALQSLPELRKQFHLPIESDLAATKYTRDDDPNIESDSVVARNVIARLRSLSRKGTRPIGPETTIFHMGLDSISAVQLVSQLRKDGFLISASEILERPNIYHIVELCERRLCEDSKASHETTTSTSGYDLGAFDSKHRPEVLRFLDIDNGKVEAIWPCTSTQIGMISEYLKSNGTCYYNSLRFGLDAGVDMNRLSDALRQVVKLHVMLRVGFVEVDDIHVPYAMVVYCQLDPDVRRSKNGTRNCVQEGSLLQKISRPPWHLELGEGSDNSMELHILHALYDAHSLNIILDDLAVLYYGSPVSQPPSVSRALSLILAENSEVIAVNDLPQQKENEPQNSKFPDLNILRDVPANIMTSKIDMQQNFEIVQDRCESLGHTFSAVVQAAWAQLLSAYTGQQKVVFGTVYSGRTFSHGPMNEVAFPCINTLPAFVDNDSDIQVIDQITQSNAQWLKNPHLSFARIKALLNIEGDLFDTIVVLQNSSYDVSSAPWQIESENATAEYAISLEVIPMRETIRLQLTYNQSNLPPQHANILLKQYEHHLCQQLGLPAPEFPVPGIMSSAKPASCDLIPTDQFCLHQLVLSSADIHPQEIAIEYITNISRGVVNRQTWTYEQLVTQATQIANLLIEHGSLQGDMVAICCEKCPQASFALLGILMAGCTYVAIDPDAPAARRDFILKDASCKIMLTTSKVVDGFKNSVEKDGHEDRVSFLCIDDYSLLNEQSTRLDSDIRSVSSQDVCYCLYTSGTTGTPKGCLITHQSAVQAMLSFSRIFSGHWSHNSKWLQFAAYHFDVSVLEHFWTWKEGLCVTIVPRDLLFEDLPGTINTLQITHLDLTPSLARLLTPGSVPSLCRGVFIVGGEPVRHDIIETWGDAGCLYNFYGPSEVTIGCTVHPRVQRKVRPTNIGHQWDNVGAYIFRPGSQDPVPVGAVGELCLAGVLTAKGYLNRPDLTAEKFCILEATGERIYRTGDLVRRLHDCSIDFIGRIDDQVKLRGQRLEIGEINNVLLTSSGFEDIATLVLEHPQQRSQHLVSFLAIEKSRSRGAGSARILLDQEDYASILRIRQKASNHLPGYMVPTYFIVVDFLPLTVNNKVDTKALRAMYEMASLADIRRQQEPGMHGEVTDLAAYNSIINVIANYFDLSVGAVNGQTSVFQLGLDSISAIGLVRAIKRAGYPNVTVTTILKKPLIADLTESLFSDKNIGGQEEQSDTKDALKRISVFANRYKTSVTGSLRLSNNTVGHIAPCTPLQEGMISKLVTSDSVTPPYMAKFVYKLENSIDIGRLVKAWNTLKSQLDILRTHFVETDGGYAQAVLSPCERKNVHVDYGVTFIEDDPLSSIDDSFRNWISSAKDLGHVCPWEVWITQRSERRLLYMSIFMFHGLYDGVSMQVLLNLLHRYYQDENYKFEAPQFQKILPYGPLQHKTNALEFWRQHIQQIQPLKFPSRSNDQLHVPVIDRCELYLPSLQQICTSLSVTSQSLFQATWLYVLADQFQINPTIGIVLSGRSIDLEGAENTIGPLFNTLPFTSNQMPQNANFRDLAKRCHEKNVDMLPFQHTPLSSIRKWLGFPSNQELFDSIFVYQTAALGQVDPDLPWVEVQSESEPDYALNIEIEQLDTCKYAISIVARPESLKLTDVTNLLESLKSRLENMSELLKQSLPQAFFAYDEHKITDSIHTEDKTRSQIEEGQWSAQNRTVANILATLAGYEGIEIGLHSPTIFELGLDSVDALKIAARLKSENLRLPVSKILQHPTVAGIAAQCTQFLSSNLPLETANMPFYDNQATWRELLEPNRSRQATVGFIVPTTPLQQGLLLEFEKYYHTLVYKINNEANISRLVEAIHTCRNTMAILRTSFAAVETPENTKLFQIVGNIQAGGRKPQITSFLRDTEELKDRLRQKHNNGELADSCPQIEILRLDDGSNYLTMALSHASYDAWSMQLILHHIEKVYTGDVLLSDDAPRVAAYVHAMQTGSVSAEYQGFWSYQIAKASSCLVSTAPSNSLFPAARVRQVAEVPMSRIDAVCRRYGISVQSLGVTLWALSLSILTKQLDINFGVVVSGRVDVNTHDLVFPTFNTIVFRSLLDTKASKLDLLQGIHRQLVTIFEYQQFPLSRALKIAGCSEGQLFNTLFTFQKTPDLNEVDPPLFEEVDIAENEIEPPYAINVEMQEVEQNLLWTVAVQKGVMSATGIADILETLDKLLECFVDTECQEIFETTDDIVSICALASFTPAPPEYARTQQEKSNGEDEETAIESDWSEIENQIRGVFASVSATDKSAITKRSSLYHLGLDSVSAIKVSRSLREAGLKIPVSMILQGQTIAKIAQLVDETKGEGSATRRDVVTNGQRDQIAYPEDILRVNSISSSQVESILPATGGQSYMLDMWRASRERLFYATFSFDINDCDEDSFKNSFHQLTREVPALRTRFVTHQGKDYQIVFTMDSGVGGAVKCEAIQRADGLLVALHIHHALYDAISLNLMVQRLKELCHSQWNGLGARLGLVTNQQPFLDAIHSNESNSKRFWTSYLAGIESPTIPTGNSMSPRTDKFIRTLLNVENLDNVARKEGLTIQAILFAAIAHMRGKACSGPEGKHLDTAVLGIYLANRSLDVEHVQDLVAPTFNVVTLRVKIGASINVLDAAREVQQDLQDVSRAENCGISMRDIYAWTGVTVDCYVNYLRLPDWQAETVEAGREGMGIEIRHAQGEAREQADELIKSNGVTSPYVDSQVTGNDGTEWCLPALDIEAKLDEYGNLAVGLFAPQDMMDGLEADRFLDDLRTILLDVGTQ